MNREWHQLTTDAGILAIGLVLGAALSGREAQFNHPPKWDCQDIDDAWVFVQTGYWPAFGGSDSQVAIVADLESGRWSYRQLKARCKHSGT